jgi:integrase
MGFIEKRTHKTKTGRRSTYWRVRYEDPATGALRSESFPREVDARRFLATNTADILRGQWVDPALGDQLFSEVAQMWRDSLIGEDTTFDRVDSVLKCHILPTFGERPIGAIRPSAVQAWAKDRSRVLAPRTLEVVYRNLVSIFRLAVSDGLIPRSPCVGIKLPPIVKTKVKPITADEVLAVMESLPARYRGLVVVGAGAGLRPGEAFGLTVPRIEFLRREIHVEQQLVTVTGTPPYLRRPKRHSVRTVPVGTWVVEELARQFEEFPPVTAAEGINGGDELLVFTNADGRPIRRTRFAEVWRTAAQAASLPPRTTPHDLRHHYASLLIAKGASVKVVQERLGHKNATETLETYAHLWPDDEDLTRGAVDAVYRPRPTEEDLATGSRDVTGPNS